jgi:hypothetical protein
MEWDFDMELRKWRSKGSDFKLHFAGNGLRVIF